VQGQFKSKADSCAKAIRPKLSTQAVVNAPSRGHPRHAERGGPAGFSAAGREWLNWRGERERGSPLK